MKKLSVFLVIGLFILFAGCDQVKEVIGAVSDSVTLSDEEIYSGVSRLISSPNSSTNLTGKFTFYALILSDEAELFEFENGESGTFHYATIARNLDDFFLLEVSKADIEVTYGDIVKVTGEIGGFIYDTVGNKREEALYIDARSMELHTPGEAEPNTSGTITIDGNDVEFLGAHKSTAIMSDIIVVYFNFTNNSSKEVRPSLNSMYIEYGENYEQLSPANFGVNDIDPNALSSSSISGANTFPGKTERYYAAYEIDKDSGGDEAIYLYNYDDEFRIKDYVVIPVLESLEALTTE